ncbi:MAG: extracellular solute-binding protein [Oscillospiraceae bacterium]|nr:extracellular solute-binding protein [Oscillospiraceae bacterium]
MMKKWIALLLALVMAFSLIACGAAEETTETTTPDTETTETTVEETPEEHEEATIEVWIAQVDWADAWDALEEKFEEEHPWIEVEHVGLGEDNTFLASRIAANDLPDVIQSNNTPNMDAMVAGDMLVDLTDWECAALMADTYKDAYTKDGKLVGMCQGAAFSCMFYNMAILEEAGWTEPPASWDELMQCCADIEAKTDAAPLVTAAGKTTTSWMILELVLANLLNDADAVKAYQEDFKNGTFDWAGVPGLVERMDQIAPYFLEGSAAALEEDAAAYMTDGLAAMCLAGNWNGGMLADAITTATGDASKVVATLPPFGDGETTWISNSPEDAFCVTVDETRTEAEQAAVETFFNWLFEGENFKYIQNARGTVPVISSMTDDLIALPECMLPVVPAMNAAPAVLMGFNLWAAEFSDAANGMIKDLLSGNATAQAMVDKMVEMMPLSFKNQ